MTATIRGSVINVTASAVTSITGNKPTGTVSGDLLIAFIHGNASAEQIVTADATTWTELDNDGSANDTQAVLFRRAGGSEPSTYSFKRADDGADDFSLTIIAIEGSDPGYDIDDWWDGANASSTTVNGPDIESRMDNMLLIAALGIGSNATVTSSPSGYTLVADNDGFNPGISVYQKVQTTKGATGTQAWTVSASSSLKSYIIPIRPEGDSYEGPRSPGTQANTDNAGGNAWSNPSNAASSNNSRAQATLNGTAETDYLDLTNFGFNIPTGATVTGVMVTNEASRSGGTTGNMIDARMQLIKGGTAQGDNKAGAEIWGTTDFRDTYGDMTDMWGLALAPSDINASNFGVRYAAKGAAAGADRTARVDHIQVWVFYTEDGEDLIKIVDELGQIHETRVRSMAMNRVAPHHVEEIHETKARSMAMTRTKSDLSEIHETSDRAIGLLKAISDIVQIHESIARSMALVRTRSDIEQVHESIARARTLVRKRDDVSEVHESISILRGLFKAIDDIEQSHETSARSRALTRFRNDVEETHESVARSRAMTRLRNEVTNALESISKTKALARQVSNHLEIHEEIARTLGIATAVNDLVQIHESVGSARGIAQVINNLVQVLETLARSLAVTRPISELEQIHETRLKSEVKNRFRNDSVEVHESIVAASTLNRVINDLVQTLESIAKAAQKNRIRNELTITLDEPIRSRVQARAISMVVNILETTARFIDTSTLLLLQIGEATSYLAMRVKKTK